MRPWPKILLSLLVAVIVGISGALLYSAFSGGHDGTDPTVASKGAPADPENVARLEEEQAELKLERQLREREAPASAGTNGTPGQSASASTASSVLQSSFSELESEVSGQIGVSVAPFGSTPPQQIGELTRGHAWSSFKVPIVVTLMKQGALSPEEMEQARAAVTASDNEAAAALFARLGDTPTASAAVERVLAESGYPTVVATAPPPPGAVSTWGQTDWSLDNSAGFYRALACEELGLSQSQTEYVLGLMEEVIEEQQWGLPRAGINGDVAIKAGWGPDTGGSYLVRQTGVLRSENGSGGAVVTIAAEDSSGSFDAGVADIERVAQWVRDNVNPNAGSCAG